MNKHNIIGWILAGLAITPFILALIINGYNKVIELNITWIDVLVGLVILVLCLLPVAYVLLMLWLITYRKKENEEN